MTVNINDTAIELSDDSTVREALAARNIDPTGIAVALNGTIVTKSDYDCTALHDGDSLIIIKAFYGG